LQRNDRILARILLFLHLYSNKRWDVPREKLKD
jgi:hypothetical protein